MELKEIKDQLLKSEKKLEELWRSLWHRFDKTKSKGTRRENKRNRFLEW